MLQHNKRSDFIVITDFMVALKLIEINLIFRNSMRHFIVSLSFVVVSTIINLNINLVAIWFVSS